LISNTNLGTDTPDIDTNGLQLIAYPNPTGSNFQLNLITPNQENVEIKIYDMTGRLLESHKINSTEVNNQKLGAGFPVGIYNVLVKQGNTSKSIRIIKK
jgi:myo-inositol-hexaphosphate 3-phosphohydrolase